MKKAVLLIIIIIPLTIGGRIKGEDINNPKFVDPPAFIDAVKLLRYEKTQVRTHSDTTPPKPQLWSFPTLTLRSQKIVEKPAPLFLGRPVRLIADTTVFGAGNFQVHEDMFWCAWQTGVRTEVGAFLRHEYPGWKEPVTGGIGLRYAFRK